MPCQWKLNVKVHSQEKFWPKDPFEVQFGEAAKAKGGADPTLIPPITAPWYKSTVKMEKKDSPEVVFTDCGAKNGAVTARVHALKKEADWVLAEGIGSTKLLPDQCLPHSINDGEKHGVDLFLSLIHI